MSNAICIIPNCNRSAQAHEPFCSEHRDKPRADMSSQIAAGLALADRLDEHGERCASRAVNARSTDLELDLLARASTYQECAGLIRQALR